MEGSVWFRDKKQAVVIARQLNEKPEASGQRVGGRLFCRRLANAAGNEEVMEVCRRRQLRYLEKLFSLFLDVEETVFSSDPGNGLASPQPEAGQCYLRPWPFPPPTPTFFVERAS